MQQIDDDPKNAAFLKEAAGSNKYDNNKRGNNYIGKGWSLPPDRQQWWTNGQGLQCMHIKIGPGGRFLKLLVQKRLRITNKKAKIYLKKKELEIMLIGYPSTMPSPIV